MKAIIENWGPIQKCEYDLDKYIIVTYGENNIGKSYAMQAVYLLLKYLIQYALGRGGRFMAYKWGSGYVVSSRQKEMETLVKNFVESDKKLKFEITDQVIRLLEKCLEEELLPLLDSAFGNTFGTYEDILQGNPKITLIIDEANSLLFDLRNKSVRIVTNVKPIWLKKVESDFHKSRESTSRFDIYVYKSAIDSPISLMSQRMAKINGDLSRKMIMNVHAVYFLPASRSGIYTGMNSFGPILAQLSQSRAYIRGTVQIPSISEPISDYYLELTTIRQDNAKYHFTEVAKDIEKNVLRGEVNFDSKTKTITYTGQDTGKIMDMGDVSSMVSEISPITAYLKYIVRKQPAIGGSCAIIFIEEPEAHLHPKNQVELIKSFAKLTKQNVKLVIASHSNYVFNELNNLVIAGDLDESTYCPLVMKYEGGKSNTSYMEMDRLGANDDNFADIAEALFEERQELINKLLEEELKEHDTDDKATS